MERNIKNEIVPTSTLPPGRTATGTFQKGFSGNPGGRPVRRDKLKM